MRAGRQPRGRPCSPGPRQSRGPACAYCSSAEPALVNGPACRLTAGPLAEFPDPVVPPLGPLPTTLMRYSFRLGLGAACSFDPLVGSQPSGPWFPGCFILWDPTHTPHSFQLLLRVPQGLTRLAGEPALIPDPQAVSLTLWSPHPILLGPQLQVGQPEPGAQRGGSFRPCPACLTAGGETAPESSLPLQKMTRSPPGRAVQGAAFGLPSTLQLQNCLLLCPLPLRDPQLDPGPAPTPTASRAAFRRLAPRRAWKPCPLCLGPCLEGALLCPLPRYLDLQI